MLCENYFSNLLFDRLSLRQKISLPQPRDSLFDVESIKRVVILYASHFQLTVRNYLNVPKTTLFSRAAM